MNRTEAEFAIAKLSPAAKAVWESDELDGADALVIGELRDAGLVELAPSWSDRARQVQNAFEPRDSVDELLERISDENFTAAVEEFESWCEPGILDRYDINTDQARAIILAAGGKIRTAYDEAIAGLAALPSQEQAAAA